MHFTTIKLELCQVMESSHHHFKIFWVEAAQFATVFQNNLVSQQGAMSPYYQFFGKGRTSILDAVQRFGEICIVTNHVAIMNKMQNQGKHCICWDMLTTMLLNVIDC